LGLEVSIFSIPSDLPVKVDRYMKILKNLLMIHKLVWAIFGNDIGYLPEVHIVHLNISHIQPSHQRLKYEFPLPQIHRLHILEERLPWQRGQTTGL